VSEFTHDTADEGFHEIQLSGKQLVFLFIVTTTVIVVVFLCGVKVGRGARAAQGDNSDPIATSSAASPTQTAPVPDPEPPAAEPPAPVSEEPPLTYPERLGAAGNPSEKLKSQPEPAPAAKAEAARPAPPPAEDRAASPAATSGVPAAGRPGTWVVQVIATRDRNMATSIVKRLTGKNYPAFLVNPAAGPGPAYYKVHVGRYNDRGEAEQVSARIKKEEQFQSWITR
jgi:DamX protein